MKLPNAEKASVSAPKLLDYLLSTTHPVGRSKAQFFRGAGFDEKNTDLLEQRLIDLAQREEVTEAITSAYGTKYVIDGSLETPAGMLVEVRTVWILENGQDRPRFVTAY